MGSILVWQGAAASGIAWGGLFLAAVLSGLADEHRIALWSGVAAMAAFSLAEFRLSSRLEDRGGDSGKIAYSKLLFAAGSLICGRFLGFPIPRN